MAAQLDITTNTQIQYNRHHCHYRYTSAKIQYNRYIDRYTSARIQYNRYIDTTGTTDTNLPRSGNSTIDKQIQ